MSGYRSTIKARSFLYLELKKAAALYLQGYSHAGIKELACKENIFALNTENRIRDIAATISTRLQVLDIELLNILVDGNLETSKQVALYAILKTDRLFFEFMLEVFRGKYLLRDYTIFNKDYSLFFQRKAEQSPIVAAWKDYTYYKLKQVYNRILFEAGFIRRSRGKVEITRPLMVQDLKDHLKKKGDEIYLQAMLGEM